MKLDLLYAMAFVAPLMMLAMAARSWQRVSRIKPEHRAPRAELPAARVVKR